MKNSVSCWIVFCISTITSIVYGADVSSLCGDDTWLATRDMAEEICNKQNSKSSVPTLVTIRSAAEQQFISKYILNFTDSNHVWIGAKRRPYSSIEFHWSDGSNFQRFTNWAIECPSTDDNRSCVQMQSELSIEHSDMVWADISCIVENWFVCEKLQTWSLLHLQQAILDARREKEGMRDQLEAANIKLNDLTNHLKIANIEIRNLQDHPIPIGFIYVQLRDQPEPSALWTTVTWNEITSSYAGLFFRAEGNGSLEFGNIQAENSPRLTDVLLHTNNGIINNFVIHPGVLSPAISTGAISSTSHWAMRFLISSGEVRPRNTAMRIWIRTR